MISTADFSNGVYIKVADKLYRITWFQHHKPGKGPAIMRVKMKDVLGGATIERTFRGGEKFESPEVTRTSVTYSYESGDSLVFMDKDYEQHEVSKGAMGIGEKFLVEDMKVVIVMTEGKIIDVELPPSVEMEVEYSEPGAKGDTVSNTLKPAKLKNGLEVKVPLFINEGDRIKVDTRSGKYLERV
ncbi:MAG: elongation factor P [Elusimicrobia bacterium]|nr:elongation factor P [Elusimicrobiota bacterium]